MKTMMKVPQEWNASQMLKVAVLTFALTLTACGGGGGGGGKNAISDCGLLAKLVTAARSLGTIAGFESAMDLLVGPAADSASTCQIEAAMDAVVI